MVCGQLIRQQSKIILLATSRIYILHLHLLPTIYVPWFHLRSHFQLASLDWPVSKERSKRCGLSSLLNTREVNEIKKIQVRGPPCQDKWVWHYSRKGIFTIKLAYHIQQGIDHIYWVPHLNVSLRWHEKSYEKSLWCLRYATSYGESYIINIAVSKITYTIYAVYLMNDESIDHLFMHFRFDRAIRFRILFFLLIDGHNQASFIRWRKYLFG